jgi:hypothetical protein
MSLSSIPNRRKYKGNFDEIPKKKVDEKTKKQ